MTLRKPVIMRQRSLAPFMNKLGIDHNPEDHKPIPGVITLGEHQLSLDPWERSVLQDYRDGKLGIEHLWAPLLAEGLAFQMKCLHQVEQLARISDLFEQGNPDLTERQLEQCEQMINTAAIGLAVLQDIQTAIDQAIVEGELEPAKNLVGFRNRSEQSINLLKQFLGEEGFLRAQNKSETMVTTYEDDQDPFADVAPEAAPELVTPILATNASPKNLKGFYLTVLCLSALAWAVFILPNLRPEPLPQLGLAEFKELPAIQAVMARPPSLFVTLNDSSWQALTEPEKLYLLKRTGSFAMAAGYSGAQFRNQAGVPVGQWLKKTGVKLFQKQAPEMLTPPS
jgi:hypothetical protein